MKFPDAFLDQLRAAVPVSAVVGRKFKLRRQGQEFVAVEDPSLSVNDKKGIWRDFGKTDIGGDHFKFLTEVEGLSFPEAVKTVASIAGIALPNGGGGGAAESKPNGRDAHADSAGEDVPWDHADDREGTGSVRHTARKIEKTYDYTDETGKLIYQVVRFEPKDFRQRRPDGQGGWIWSIKDIPPLFYRLPEVMEALAEGRAVFLTEGEKDCDTLWDWGVPATTNSGGAKHWGAQNLSIFKDADVIVLPDNDEAGRKRVEIVGASLTGIAKCVRSLDIASVWKDAKKGADITDWRDEAGGTVERLYEIAKGLPDWKPAPAVSKFGRVSWRDQDAIRGSLYDWWIKGLIAKRQTAAIIGPMSCGKSFESFNLGGHIATGKDYRGLRTKQGLVIFGAPEGGAGVVDRMRAYRAEHGLPLDGIPFEALTHRFNLFSSDADVEGLIAEVKTIKADWPHFELALLIIDTWSAATTGMDENSSKDVSLVRSRIVRIERECDCGIMFVHHMNAGGERQRGHSSITADVESVLKIEMLTKWENKKQVPVHDENGRPIRRLTNFKQREAESGQHWDFVLIAKEVRKDADGDRVTSCVSITPTRVEAEPSRLEKRNREGPKGEGFHLYKDGEAEVFKAIIAALAAAGEIPPETVQLPEGIKKVVRWSDVGVEFKRKMPNDDGETDMGRQRYAWRVKSVLKRARKALLDYGIIGIDEVPGDPSYHIVWPTGKKVWGPDLRWPNGDHQEDRPQATGDFTEFYDDTMPGDKI